MNPQGSVYDFDEDLHRVRRSTSSHVNRNGSAEGLEPKRICMHLVTHRVI